jgi:hypothetical protein
MTLHPIPLNFLIYEENFISFFIIVAHFTCSMSTSILDSQKTIFYQRLKKFWNSKQTIKNTPFRLHVLATADAKRTLTAWLVYLGVGNRFLYSQLGNCSFYTL